ncbi:MAG: hypothetical protein KDD37_03715 [Bdellovibrionales bacterium]|nr:hypothetical protein [Bdellovibrionales bacterium]
MKSLQIISLLALALIAVSLSAADAVKQSKIEKDRASGCVICTEEQ